ncbi:ATP-grasp domain-containing protein [Candidatus Thorarchaeota archaeon]|nr:MAG: ATP-grasp domain-containing protein [Candidatus Thorarchaeota archaeon]
MGFNARPVACNLKKTGATVFVSDYWGDSDLDDCCDEWIAVLSALPGQRQRQTIGKALHKALVENMLVLIEELPPMDLILIGSGFDDYSDSLRPLLDAAPIIGNTPDGMKRARDRERIVELLEDSPVRVPWSIPVAESNFSDLEFPLVLRPIHSGGGSGIRLIRREETLESVLSDCEDPSGFILQEYVSGLDLSCSVLSTGNDSRALSVQGQLVGVPSAGVNCTFAYCGNYIPVRISSESQRTIEEASIELCNELSLMGSNGIDFVLNENGEVYLMEINPRIQGSLEMLETASEISVLSLHIEAVEGCLPDYDIQFRPTVKMIVYARQDSVVRGLSSLNGIADRTPDGLRVNRGDPVCTVVRSGSSIESSYSCCINDAARVSNHLVPTSDTD